MLVGGTGVPGQNPPKNTHIKTFCIDLTETFEINKFESFFFFYLLLFELHLCSVSFIFVEVRLEPRQSCPLQTESGVG